MTWRHRLLALLLACSPAASARAAEASDFDAEVRPILQRYCVKCHAGTRRLGGFSINNREELLKGGESGSVVEPGSAEGSYLIDLLLEEDPDVRMPQESPPLSAEQIAILSAWVEAELPWEQGFEFGREHRRAALAPRSVEPPAASDVNHPIDRFLEPYFRERGDSVATPVDDRIFYRRVALDLIGVLPTPSELRDFEQNTAADKRRQLVDRLLDHRRAYAEHWLTPWSDMLRNAYRGTGFIDGGRFPITAWLYAALYDNKPYDRLVHELISPVPGSEGFIRGIKWRGTVNDSQRREMQAAQNVAQVFLGTNLKCASCHDSFVNNWKLTDAYSLAAVFADQPLELHRCDRPTGEKVTAAFIYDELGAISADASPQERAGQLADIVIAPENGRFARTIVNRLWAHLMGRGLVEPLDDMDAEPWHQDLLDWLASDLVAHQYDLQHTLRTICTSHAYQLPAVAALPEDTSQFVFRGPLLKRMTAEQFVDAICTITGYWPQPTPDMLQRDGRGQGGQVTDVALYVGLRSRELARSQASWIWSHEHAMQAPAGEVVHFHQRITLTADATQVFGAFTADNQFTLYVNGTEVVSSDNWMVPVLIDLTAHCQAGENTIAVRAVNGGEGPNAAGFICDVAVSGQDQQLLARQVSDRTWVASGEVPRGWPLPADDGRAERAAVEIASAAAAPWAIVDQLLPAAPPQLQIRSALFMDDPLNRALGRPIRDQVVTRRESLATRLQAMELTNGSTLDGLLRQGAQRCLARGVTPKELFEAALGREPTSEEQQIAAQLLAESSSTEAVADLLWAIVMLPEFQLIR